MGHRADSRVPRWIGPILCCLFAASCAEEAPLETYELSGRVTVLHETDEASSGVAGARVVFVSDTLIVEETTADGSGRYRMRVSTDHPFGQVRAEAEGFDPHEETVYFDTTQRRVDIALRRM